MFVVVLRVLIQNLQMINICECWNSWRFHTV